MTMTLRKRTFKYTVDENAGEFILHVLTDSLNLFYGETLDEVLNRARYWLAEEYGVKEGNITLIPRDEK